MDTINYLRRINAGLPEQFDITNEIHLAQVIELTNRILQEITDLDEVNALIKRSVRNKERFSLFTHLALKLLKSKLSVQKIDKKLIVTVVFAMYKEHTRILPQREHEHGENFLLQKIEQLEWLFESNPNVDWRMLAVDDGCPENSGEIAKNLLQGHPLEHKVEVLFIEDAIEKKLAVVDPMKSSTESRKGGSIQYGLWYAANKHKDNHIVIFTDADLSTHLGQCGLLLDPVLNGYNAGIGSRRESESVVIKTGTRNVRGKMFIYLWKRLLPQLNHIVDTQCGFKAFRADILLNILGHTIEKQFAFDIELLLKTELIRDESVENCSIAWIDSEAASTTTEFQPYLSMLKAIVKMYQHYLTPNPVSDKFADFIQDLTEEKWQDLLEKVPAGIADREPLEFDEYDGVSAEDLKQLIMKMDNE